MACEAHKASFDKYMEGILEQQALEDLQQHIKTCSQCRAEQWEFARMQDILKDSMKKVGQRPEVYIEIGNIYFELEDYPNARDNFLYASEHFKQKRDDAAKALILAGDASMAIGDKQSAQEYYLQANLIAKSLTLKNHAAAKISIISEK